MVMKILVVLAAGATADDASVSPIARVTFMLTKMQKDTQAEAKKDAALYEKMDCWCNTNDKAKTEAIKAAEVKIGSLETDVEAHGAKIEQLRGEIKQLKSEIEKNQESLDTATAIREKENARFVAENADLVKAIGQLDNAIKSLQKFNGGPKPEAFLQVKNVVNEYSHRYGSQLQNDLLGVLAAFPDNTLRGKVSLSQQPLFNSYNSRSGEIFGILGQLKETMEKDAGEGMKEEKRAQAAYDEFSATKNNEIAVAKQQIADKEAEKSETQIKKANAEQDIRDTKRTLDADSQFLMDLKEKCASWDSDYEQRTKTRNQEITAISEALKIVTSDEARDIFSATKNIAFAQLSSSHARGRAAAVLRAAVQRGASSMLLTLASSAQLDAFTKVKEMMDKMAAKLKEQMALEFKKKDFCDKELSDNEDERKDANNKLEDLDENIASLTDSIDTLTEEIAQLKTDVSTLRTAMKKAGEDRRDQNKLYQQSVSDARATVHILEMALVKLQEFYAPDALKAKQPVAPTTSLLQGDRPEDFQAYKAHGSASGVLEVIQEIQADARAGDNIAVKSEQDAQAAYAAFIGDSNDSINKDLKSIVDKQEAKAKFTTDRAQAKGDHESTTEALMQLRKTKADLHSECDFLIKNFDVRQASLQDELDAIAQAKAILSGATFE